MLPSFIIHYKPSTCWVSADDILIVNHVELNLRTEFKYLAGWIFTSADGILNV